jgi:hypothetical protein
MQDSDSIKVFEDLLAEQKKVVTLLENAAQIPRGETKRKDFWDKFATLSTFLSSVLIASIGLIFTSVYNARQNQRNDDLKKQEIHLAEIQTLEKFMPHLTGDEKSKEIAILAMSSLGNTELAARLATLYPTKGTVSALTTIAQSGDEGNRTVADAALKAIFSKNRPASVDVDIETKAGPAKLGGLFVNSDGYVAAVEYSFKHPDPEMPFLFDKPVNITTVNGKRYAAKPILIPKGEQSNPGIAIYKIDGSGYVASRLAESPPALGDPVLVIEKRVQQSSSFSEPSEAVPLIGKVEKIEDQYLTVTIPRKPEGKSSAANDFEIGGAVVNMQGQIVGVGFASIGPGNSDAVLREIYVRSDAILGLLKEHGVRP